MKRFRPNAMTWLILLAAVLARLAVLAPRVGREADDPDNYLPLARSIAAGRGFQINGKPTAYRPPLYPVLLAPLVGSEDDRFTVAIAAFHLVLGVGTTLLTMRAARLWGLSAIRMQIAGLIVALDPVLVAQSRSVMTETLAAFLLAAAMATASTQMRGMVICGVAFGLASLCRPSTLPAAVLACAFAATTGPGMWTERARRSLALALAVAVTLAPWAIRNAIVLGEPIATTTHGGYTLALANNAAYARDVLNGPPGAVWSGPRQRAWFQEISQATDRMSEPQADRFLRNSALRWIREHPGDFLRASLARLGRFWGLAPSSSVYGRTLRWAAMMWTLPLWVAAIAGLFSRDLWKWPRAASLAAVMALTIVHVFYWTDLRMRAPIVPAIAIIAVSSAVFPSKKKP